MPGFDDRGWQAAADLGINGVAPWNKRPSISENAHWIWTADAGANQAYNQNNYQNPDPNGNLQQEGHDNIFCRFTQPNQEINCYAAQAKYLEDNPDAKDNQYPAWLHYVDIGKAEGRAWPSDRCNTCTETTRGGTGGGITTQCDASVYNQQLGQCFNTGSTTDGTNAGGTSWMDNTHAAGVNGEQYVESHGQEGL